ncbi:MAG TPA: ATP synthase F0 subunit B [Nitrospirota bacterium]|nr:ATP synthase F0 subunit B [Nitrospirota bacterium]
MMIPNKLKQLLFCLTITLTAAFAFAEEAAEGGHEQITFLGDWLPRLVNFGIIAGVVVYFMRKPVRDFFKNRSLEIAKAIQESKEARERSTAALAEMERKVKDLEAETSRLLEDARSRAEKDKQALIDEGRKMVSDIDAQVKQGVDLEVQKAKTALQAEASMLAVDLSEKSIKEKIGPQDHERIVKEYITKVGGRG